MPIPQTPPVYQQTWKHQHDQPPAKKKGGPKKRRWLSRLLLLAVILVLLCAILVVAAFAWYSRELPDPNKLLTRNLAQSTRIYDRTGETLLYEIHGDVKRTLISLEEIPDNLKNATIAIEDKHFYEHSGFDITGLIRAILINITSIGKSRPGGSTITQQLVKNAILTTEKTFTRKIKELVLSYQIERKFSKDQILKLYFNEIPYGSVSYGVESASQIYFGKSARDLNLAECAILAALPQSPTYYSPYGNHIDELIGRQHYILDLMVEQNYITREQAEEAKNYQLDFKPQRESITAPHFVFYVKELLTEKYGEKMVEQGGLKVITTLDAYKQQAAETAVTDGLEKIKKYGGSNAALVALDPKTGEILSMVGSVDYFDTENDGNVNVSIRNRQPGSSFKPVVYATAFTKGYTPETMLFDLKTNFGGDPAYIPNNYDGREHGPVSMRQALAGSLNIPAVKTLYLAGLDNTLETAAALGYTTLTDKDRYGLSLTLGGGEVKLLEHTGAFATFAREGLRHPSQAILRVEDKDGKVLEESKTEEIRVMDENVARDINSILSDNGARSFIFGSQNYLTLSDRPVAAKTGTTNDFRDAWTIGYTPSLVAGVWAGNNDNTEMKRGADGSVIAAPIWHNFMETLLKGTPVETFKSPKVEAVDKMMLNGQIDIVHSVKVDILTNRVIPDDCVEAYPKEYQKDKIFKETHSILYYVNKSKPRDSAPDDPAQDPQFSNWEAAVQAWADGQPDYITPNKPLRYESCELRQPNSQPDNTDEISLLTPTNNQVITQSPLRISAQASSSFKLNKIELYLDNTLVGEIKDEQLSLDIDVSDKPNGFYTLKAIFYNQAGEASLIVRELNILLSTESASFYLTQPQPDEIISLDDFPYSLSGLAYHPDGVESVSVFYQAESDVLIGEITEFTLNQFQLIWTDPPKPGDYKIYLQIKTMAGHPEKGDSINITLTD